MENTQKSTDLVHLEKVILAMARAIRATLKGQRRNTERNVRGWEKSLQTS